LYLRTLIAITLDEFLFFILLIRMAHKMFYNFGNLGIFNTNCNKSTSISIIILSKKLLLILEEKMQENREAESSSAGRSLFSGAIAGLAVDLILYPLDTMKTRMQSKQGFKLSGGLNSMYRGVRAVAVGSAPGSALFFFTYSYSKDLMGANGLILMFFSNW
jgi:hypothetical protein